MTSQNTLSILLIATFAFIFTCEDFGIGIGFGGHYDHDNEEPDFFGGLFGHRSTFGHGGHDHQHKEQHGFGCEQKQRKGHARAPQGKSCHNFQLGDTEYFEVPINGTMGIKECICISATNVGTYFWNCTSVDTKILGTASDLIPIINGTVVATVNTSVGVE